MGEIAGQERGCGFGDHMYLFESIQPSITLIAPQTGARDGKTMDSAVRGRHWFGDLRV